MICFCACGAKPIAAQDKIEIGAMAGASFYLGDLNPQKLFSHTKPALGGVVRYNFTDRWAAKAVATLVNIAGQYPESGDVYVAGSSAADQQYSFSKTLIEVGAMGEVNFRSFDHVYRKDDSKWTPYLTAGIAAVAYESYDEQNNTETVFVLSLPFGFGAKYKVNKWLRVGAEWRLCKTFADDLDYAGHTANQINPRDPYGFGKSPLLNNNDWYQVLGATVTLSMWPRKLSCNDGTQRFNK